MGLDVHDITKDGFPVPKCNESTIDPTVNDDNTAGYDVGDKWVNTTSDEELVIVDSTTGAAVWKSTTAIGGGVTADQACLSLLRTTSLALTTTAINVTYDQEDIENEPLTLEHDDVNTERIYLHDSAYYYGSVNLQITNTFNQERTFTIELHRNDTQLLSSNDVTIAKSSTEHVTRNLIIPPLTAGDYVTLKMYSSANGDLTLDVNSRVVVFQLKGTKGDTGATGAIGADGDITWEGDWVSQNYTTNQAVSYQGSSYVCHTNTTASQVPADVGYWDTLAEKGVAGSGQNRIDISVHPHNDDKKSTASATYVSLAKFLWAGSTLLGTPLKIYSNCYQGAAGSGGIRIYDLTNSAVIAESAAITSTAPTNIVDLGTISNIGVGQAVWEIQIKGDGTNINNVSSVSVEF